MQFNDVSVIGLIAGTLTTLAFLPQVIKTFRTRSTDDISLTMFVVLVVGIILWIVHGFLIQDLSLIAANVVTFILAGTILVLKVIYKKKK